MSKIKVFAKLNLQNVYHFIRLTTKKENVITFYQENDNNINERKNVMINNM